MALRNCSELSLSLRAAAAAVMMLAFAASALASDWTGAGDGLSWNDPGNWSDGVVPGPGDSVTVTDEFVQVTSAVSVLNLTLIRATISGNGNLTITGSLSMPDGGTLSGNGRLIIAAGAAGTITSLTQATPLTIGRRIDVNGELTVTGPVTTTLNGSVTVGATGTLSSIGTSITLSNNAVLTNGGVLNIRNRSVGLLGGARVVNSGTLNIGRDIVNQPTVVDGTTVAPAIAISSTGTVNMAGAGGVNLLNGQHRFEFTGPVNILSGPVAINGSALFSQPITVAANAALTLRPLPANGMSLNGNPAIDSAGSVFFDGGVFAVPFPLAGSGPLIIAGAELQFGSDTVLNRSVSMGSGSFASAILGGEGVITVAGVFDWGSGELRGAADFIVAAGAILNVGSLAHQSTINRSSRPIRNHGTVNVNATQGAFQPAATSGQLINDGVVNVLAVANPTIPLRNLAGAILQSSAPPGAFGTEANWTNIVENAGLLRVTAGVFGVSGPTGVPLLSPGTLQSDSGATLMIGSVDYGATGTITGAGTVSFTGVNEIDDNYLATGPFQVGAGSTVTLRSTISFASLLPIDGRLILAADQQWPDVRINGSLGGNHTLTVTNSIVLAGAVDTGATLIVAQGATLTTFSSFPAINGTLINRGTASFSPPALTFDGGALINEGAMTISLGIGINTSGAPSRLVNSGNLVFQGGFQGAFIELPGPDVDHPGRVPLRFENSGSLQLPVGGLAISGGGFNSSAFQIPANGILQVKKEFTFASPVAATGPGAFHLGQAVFDMTTTRIDSTGPIELRGTITLAHAIHPSSLPVVNGVITLTADQSWPKFGFGGVIRGPGNLTITSAGAPDWTSGAFEGPGTVTFASGLLLQSNGTTPLLFKTTVINNGTFNPSRVRLDGGTLINNGTLNLFDRIEGAGAGGPFTNNGVLVSLVPGASIAPAPPPEVAPAPVPLLNNGTVLIVNGTLVIARPLNFDGATMTLAGGTWSIEGTGTLTLTGAQIRSIGPGTTVSLLSAGGVFPALAGLAVNAGTLVVGTGRTQNITPVGGTFTNAGEVLLRAGSIFNVVGDYLQPVPGILRAQIGGASLAQNGRLNVVGTLTFGGAVITEYANGYRPASCNATIPFMTAGDFAGSPANFSPAPINGRASTLVVGPATASLLVRNPADVATIGGLPPGDNLLTADDVIVYLSAFFSNNLSIADVAALGGALTPDGAIMTDDLIAFLNSFFAGCS